MERTGPGGRVVPNANPLGRNAIVDPRTGEIIKGDVLLGSQRVRQDRLIFEGLAGADKSGQGGPNDPIEIALARLRQLAPHEIGHSIGLQHNFAASTYGDRASVMDYPAPRIAIKNGQLDFSDAYGRGVGAWDKFVIDWLYGVAPTGVDEKAWLKALSRDFLVRSVHRPPNSNLVSWPPNSAS